MVWNKHKIYNIKRNTKGRTIWSRSNGTTLRDVLGYEGLFEVHQRGNLGKERLEDVDGIEDCGEVKKSRGIRCIPQTEHCIFMEERWRIRFIFMGFTLEKWLCCSSGTSASKCHSLPFVLLCFHGFRL
ncbi:hypothetical protein RUM43_012212 [Polyplax serrata]|uniref:Uncharacterized protein n=1 Tax=Polyplax serrata TaxID=468196 RepID=A0AAN8NWV1_POLSC